MKNAEISAEIGLPWGLGSVGGKWVPDEAEERAAWEILVELTTRVCLVEVKRGEGSVREALTSLRELFPLVRTALKSHGPILARPMREAGEVSFGYLAVAVLNGAIRPFLSRWHSRLSAREEARPEGTAAIDWESSWQDLDLMLSELKDVQASLATFAGIMSKACRGEALVVAAFFTPVTNQRLD